MLFKNAFSTYDKIFGNKFLKLCLATLQEQPRLKSPLPPSPPPPPSPLGQGEFMNENLSRRLLGK